MQRAFTYDTILTVLHSASALGGEFPREDQTTPSSGDILSIVSTVPEDCASLASAL